jgi:hypothetical protein
MKILLATSDYDDRILALLEFKKLNVAHSIDFVSDCNQLEEYLTAAQNRFNEIPNLLLVNSNILTKASVTFLTKIKSNDKWSQLEVVVFSSFSNLRKIMIRNEDLKAESRTTNPDELTWILREICDGLASRVGWQYHIKPAVAGNGDCMVL